MNKDLISQFANSEDCRNYMEFADYVLLIMQTDFPLLNYPYCVGQMQHMITSAGLGDLLTGKWTRQDIFEGSNFVLSNSELPFADRLLIATTDYWKASDPDTAVVVPFGIEIDGTVKIYFPDQKKNSLNYCSYVVENARNIMCIYGYNPKYSETSIYCKQLFDIKFE